MASAGHGKSENAQQDELDPDEPRTPLWLPLLGLCLFFAALVYALTGTGKSDEAQGAAAEAPGASAAPSAAAP